MAVGLLFSKYPIGYIPTKRYHLKNVFNKKPLLTVVNLSSAANLSSWVAADFSKASCFLIRASTASRDSWKYWEMQILVSYIYSQEYIIFTS